MSTRTKIEEFLTRLFVDSTELLRWIDNYFPALRANLRQNPSLTDATHDLYSYLEAVHGTLPEEFWDALREFREKRSDEINALQALATRRSADSRKEPSIERPTLPPEPARRSPGLVVTGATLDVLQLIDAHRSDPTLMDLLQAHFSELTQGTTNTWKRCLRIESGDPLKFRATPALFLDEEVLATSWTAPNQPEIILAYYPRGRTQKSKASFDLRVERAPDGTVTALRITNAHTSKELSFLFAGSTTIGDTHD